MTRLVRRASVALVAILVGVLGMAAPAMAAPTSCTQHPYYSTSWGEGAVCLGSAYNSGSSQWEFYGDFKAYDYGTNGAPVHISIHFHGDADNYWWAYLESSTPICLTGSSGTTSCDSGGFQFASDQTGSSSVGYVDQVRIVDGGMPAYPNKDDGGPPNNACLIIYNASGPANNC